MLAKKQLISQLETVEYKYLSSNFIYHTSTSSSKKMVITILLVHKNTNIMPRLVNQSMNCNIYLIMKLFCILKNINFKLNFTNHGTCSI